MKAILIGVCMLLSMGPAALAADPAPTTRPDQAADIQAAVAARRGETALSKLAASMKPGTWAQLKSETPRGLWSSPLFDGGRSKGGAGGLHIAGWTNDAHWDSRTGQFLYMGLRQTRQFVAYSEEKNAWRAIPLDPKSDNPVFLTQYGHVYGTNGFDPANSRFYHLYRSYRNEKHNLDLTGGISYFDVRTGKWTKLPPRPEGSGGMCIEYFSAMGGLVTLGKHAFILRDGAQKWEDLGPSPVDGYHSMFRHNPYRGELLMAGGNNNRLVVARITREGKIERLKDMPEAMSVRSDKLTVDPSTGRYLFMLAGDSKKGEKTRLWEFDSDANEFREVAGFAEAYPYNRYAMPVCTFIPEYGVIMWAEPKGVYLYKHKPAGD